MEQRDGLTFLDRGTTFDEGSYARQRRDCEAVAIYHFDTVLRAVLVMGYGFEGALKELVVDERGEDPLAAIAHAVDVDGGAPAQLGADSDLAQRSASLGSRPGVWF